MSRIVSAPGKVLLTGGYVILENEPGVVMAVNSRVFCQVTDMEASDISIEGVVANAGETIVAVNCPQLGDAVIVAVFSAVNMACRRYQPPSIPGVPGLHRCFSTFFHLFGLASYFLCVM